MLTIKEVKKFQEFLLNSWPAEQYYFLNGWILRFNKGVTYRANSVFPIYYTGDSIQIEQDIKNVEKVYKLYGLPSIFTMHEYFEPGDLDFILKNRGYVEEDHTNALIAPIDEIHISKINRNFEYEISNERTDSFSGLLARFTQRDSGQQEIIHEIVNRIILPKKCFLLAKKQNEIIGTLMGVLNPNGYVYIADLFVIPDYRRMGIASSLMAVIINDWAIPNRAKYTWLQVEVENNLALRLYEKLGMKRAYSYYYLRKDFQE
jgi:ribosomal protein S18 acetylase RimI-like enzyme